MNELPYEILCEIFSRCVDHSSARVDMQPNTKIAPMLLCQVCAPWRAVVLSTPALWAHLRFDLPVNWYWNRHPRAWAQNVLTRRLEWLRWWRRNLGAMAPYPQVELRRKQGEKYRRGRLSEAICEFLLELMSSAQYISVGLFYQYLVQRRREAGYAVSVHCNAHSIVSTGVPTSEYDAQKRSTLRHLMIENAEFRREDFTNPLNNWSRLTRLSLSLGYIHIITWFSFIRSVRALQSGSFEFTFLDTDINTYTRPPVGTLPCLKSLHISAFPSGRGSGQYPLTSIFDNLHLPRLRTLSLESRAAS
jgi:hypothetical protein